MGWDEYSIRIPRRRSCSGGNGWFPSAPHRHVEPARHVRRHQGHEHRHAALVDGDELEPAEHGAGHELHLHERHLLAQARPWPRLEHRVLERRYAGGNRGGGRRHVVLGQGQPALQAELGGVGAPDGLHPPHPVLEVGDAVTALHAGAVGEDVPGRRVLRVPRHGRVQPHGLAQRGVEHAHLALPASGVAAARGRGDVPQDLPLHVAVAGEQPEEPRQRRRRGVAPGHDEADHHVADRLVGVPAFDHPRQQVAPPAGVDLLQLLQAALLLADVDEVHDGLVDDPDLLAEPALGAHVQRALRLPHGGYGGCAAPGDDPGRRVERRGQPGRLGQCRVQAPGVNAQRHAADDVEGEAAEQVLHVNHAAARRGQGQRRDEPLPRLVLEHGKLQVPERARRELVAHQLPLRVPQLAVNVEDACTEQVAEDVGEGLPLGVVAEVALEDVLHVGRVRGHHGPPRAETVHHDRLRRRRRQQLGVPVQQPPPVLVEGDQAPNHRVAPGPAAMAEAGPESDAVQEEEEAACR